MKELYILGASGHGRVVFDVAKSMKKYGRIKFFDDGAEAGKKVPIEGNSAELIRCARNNPSIEVIVAIGDNVVRRQLQNKLEQENVLIATLVHENAIISDTVKLGVGTVVMPGVVINNGTVIGKSCIINTSSSTDHDNIVEDYCHISVGSHLAGNVQIGEGTLIGAGAIVKNNITICANCLIGAGAVVVGNIDTAGNYMGVPAKLRESVRE